MTKTDETIFEKVKLNFYYLPDYAKFLLKNKQEELASTMLIISREEEIPLLKYVKILPERKIIELFRKNTKELLDSIVKMDSPNYINLNLKKWIGDQFAGINTTKIVAKDITCLTFIYRKTLRRFLADYTSEMAISMQIIDEADRFTSLLEEISFNRLFHFNEQNLDNYYSKGKETFPKLEDRNQQLQEAHTNGVAENFAWDFDGDSSIPSLHLMNFFELNDNSKLETFLKNVHPFDIEKIREALNNSLINSELYECYYRFQKIQNGKVIWSRGVVTFQDGMPVKMKGSMMDVSQNYLLNQQLKESEKTFRQLIQNAPDAIIVNDENNNILLWNPKAEAIFGWTADEIIGKTLVETIIPLRYTGGYLNGVNLIKATIHSDLLNKSIEITAINKEGEEFFVAISIASSLWNGRQVFISFIRNITKEKKVEKELERHRKQLSQKNKELQKMNTELSSFSYVASHDLKEPLRKIKTYSNLIIEKHNESLTDDGKEYIKRIIHSTGNMQRLIDDLLAFSQTSSGVKKLETLDLNVLLEEVENSLKDTIEENNVTITSTQLPTLRVIDFQFRQLLENLIGNAIKYRRIGIKPQINITSSLVSGKSYINEGADANKNYHRFLFTDNGIGFEQEYATKIFEIFQRLHGKSEYSGTGIGLAICKKIMENHKGFITAQSKVGEGSVFNVFFPVKVIVAGLDS
ncbi:MAG: PAS domain S-box protein [Bacteroidetes bacterium]|nr:PAS domain S-box protein [Bacteroidota bacterium]